MDDILSYGWVKAPWGFRGEEGHSQHKKNSRCSVMRSLAFPIDGYWKLISGDSSYNGQGS